MRGFLFTFILFLSSGSWATIPKLTDLTCPGEGKKSQPFLRVGLSPNAFENQIEKILSSQIESIVEATKSLDLRNQAIGQDRGVCPKERDKPGMDAEFLCLYLPKALFGEFIDIRDFKNEILSSIGLRMNFDQVRIPRFELKNPQMSCSFDLGQADCELAVDVPIFEIEGHFDFINPRKNKKIFSTVSPLRIIAEATKNKTPRIHLKATLNSGGNANEAIRIIEDSLKFEIPDETLTSVVENNFEDTVKRAMEMLEEQIDPELGEKERTDLALKMLESEEGERIFDMLKLSYSAIEFTKRLFRGEDGTEKDFLLVFKEPLLNHIDEPLSELITEIIQKVLPFNENVEFHIPVPPTQDQIDGPRYLQKFAEITAFISEIEDEFYNPKKNLNLRKLSKSYRKELKRIRKFISNIQGTQLASIGKELSVLSVKLRSQSNSLSSAQLIGQKLDDEIKLTAQLAETVAQSVSEDKLPIYRKSLLHVDKVGRVDSSGLEVLISGCHIGGLEPEIPEDWHLEAPNQPLLDGNEFAMEIPVSLLNQHLKLLHDNNFYDYCVSRKGNSCAEVKKQNQTWYKINKAPRIKLKNDQYIFEMPEVERTNYTFLPDFLDKSFLRDSTRIRVCLDDLVVDSLSGTIIPKGCIDADANVDKNFRIEHAISFVNLWSAVAVLGIKLTHTAAQEIVLKNMEDRSLARSVDNILLRNGEYQVRELRVENERLSIFGKVQAK